MTAATPAENQTTGYTSTVYGPVASWRFGHSLGIDLIRDRSTCSFNCIYCQLGDIQVKTAQRQLFVATDKVLQDFAASNWQTADIITFSGSGEPTLALNCGEAIRGIKAMTKTPIMVLTNGTLLNDPAVQADLMAADQVSVKLDAATDAGLRQMNRPVAGVTLEGIIAGAIALRKVYPGKLSIQTMFMPANRQAVDDLAEVIRRIGPDEVQLNTPKRPYPLEWHVESRGNHSEITEYPTARLRTVEPDDAGEIEAHLAQKTGIPILSIYRRA